MHNRHPAVELTAELVRINSENPCRLEGEIIRYIAAMLDNEGISYQLIEVAPERSNLVVKLKGQNKRPPIALIAHCDTVPAGSGWEKNPFGGEIIDGRLYGRGSCDMKAGLAAALYAVKHAAKTASLPGDLVFVASVDEEGPDMLGILNILDSDILTPSTLIIAPEPTELHVVRAHRGVMWYEVEVHGRASHGGHAERGIDANHALAEVICELKAAVNALPFQHPLLGSALLSVGKMSGGEKTNMVPNKAIAEIDFRIVPPLTAEDANMLIEKATHRAIQRVPGATVKIRNLGMQRSPVETPENSAVVNLLCQSYAIVLGHEPTLAGYVAYTDAAVVSLLTSNQNSVCFGPGNLEQAHAVDEWTDISQIEHCAEIFKHLVCSGGAALS